MSNNLDFTWHWSPFTLLALIMLCVLYVVVVRIVGPRRQQKVEKRRVAAFCAAIVLIALMLLTPIDIIARTQLLLAHMVQVVTLITFCAPLLLYSCPRWLAQWAVDNRVTRPLIRFLTQPVIASAIFNITFLIWYAPRIYNATLINGTLYHIELWAVLLTSLLNWWPLIGPDRSLHRLGYPVQMLYAFIDGQPVDIFAFLLVFTEIVFYPQYHIPASFSSFGYNALADQTVAGSLLLIPGIVDLVVMSPLFFRWLGQIEQRAKLDDERRAEEARLAAEAEDDEDEDYAETGIAEAEA